MLRNAQYKLLRVGPKIGRYLVRISLLLMMAVSSARAATYNVSAVHLTMHVGDPVPPLIFRVSEYSGKYSDLFRGEPRLSTSVTSAYSSGNYEITVSQGSMRTVNPSDHLQFTKGVLTIIPAGPTGARLSNDVSYPEGFLRGSGGYSLIDVTHNSIANLIPDCVSDNATAFDRLLTQSGRRTPATTNGGATPLFLYFPPGCYATSQPLTIYGNTWTLWGAGPQRSYIRLLPNSPAFNVGKPTQFFNPQSVTRNSNFREFIYNLGFNIGVGNPDAIPVTTIQNNVGSMRNVQIWADDSRCPYAINFRRAYPGPMLLKDVAIYGCNAAYSSNQNEYSVTAEGLTTEGQTEIALDNGSIAASIRHWLSDNTVTAVHVHGAITATIAVLDSDLLNGAPGSTGIIVDKGASIYLKNITARGYGVTENDSGSGSPVVRRGDIRQAWTGDARSLFDGSQSPDSLHLETSETPSSEDPPVSQWTKLGSTVATWPSEIEKSRASTIYLPPGVYEGGGVVEIDVPQSVDHLQFYESLFRTPSTTIRLLIAGSGTKPLIIDGCLYQACELVHTGSRPVVIRDSTLDSYMAKEGAGNLYIEDSILSSRSGESKPVRFYPHQHIWARQLNLEQHSLDKFDCNGCTIWILGYKTEQSTPSIVLTNGAQAEIFGFFFYQNRAPEKPGTASIYVTDSSLFATGFTKVDIAGRGQPFWVIERRGMNVSSLATRDVNTSQQITMLYSYGDRRGRQGPSNQSAR
jgi:Pectate lyase superfamily protein